MISEKNYKINEKGLFSAVFYLFYVKISISADKNFIKYSLFPSDQYNIGIEKIDDLNYMT
jgi:hypothetical protein